MRKALSGLLMVGMLVIASATSAAAKQFQNIEDEHQDTALYLVEHSPFEGKWEFEVASGTLELAFKQKDGMLAGQIQNTTVPDFFRMPSFDSPVKDISIKTIEGIKTLSFTNVKTGAQYKLEITKSGRLDGFSETRSGRRVTMRLRPR